MSRKKKSLAQNLVTALLILLVVLALPLVFLGYAVHLSLRAILYLLVWLLWIPKGKDILLVYSDSPIWREYIDANLLPLMQKRAVVLNWSERNKWSPWWLRVLLFHAFGGKREFNPLVVKFQPFRRAKILRYWPAFKDWKRGYTEPIERLNKELSMML